MKKSLLMASTVVIVIAVITMFASCRKSFTCSCVTYDQNGTTTSVGNFTFSEWRDDAQNLCNNKQSNGFPNSAVPVTCELK